MRGIAAKAARGEGCVLACELHTAQGASTKAVSTAALAAAPCMVANMGAERRESTRYLVFSDKISSGVILRVKTTRAAAVPSPAAQILVAAQSGRGRCGAIRVRLAVVHAHLGSLVGQNEQDPRHFQFRASTLWHARLPWPCCCLPAHPVQAHRSCWSRGSAVWLMTLRFRS